MDTASGVRVRGLACFYSTVSSHRQPSCDLVEAREQSMPPCVRVCSATEQHNLLDFKLAVNEDNHFMRRAFGVMLCQRCCHFSSRPAFRSADVDSEIL